MVHPGHHALIAPTSPTHRFVSLLVEIERFGGAPSGAPIRHLDPQRDPAEGWSVCLGDGPSFGGGHRRCIGSAFASYEMRLAIAELVRGWDLELLEPDERPVRRSVTMGPRHGVPVRVTRRRTA